MSLDLEIGEESEYYNYTYNVSDMWYKIYPEDKGMVQIEGMTGIKASCKIIHAIEILRNNSPLFRKMEPKNKWGSYEGFLAFLKEVFDACMRHPYAIWRAYR